MPKIYSKLSHHPHLAIQKLRIRLITLTLGSKNDLWNVAKGFTLDTKIKRRGRILLHGGLFLPLLKKLKEKTEEAAKKGLDAGEKVVEKGVDVGKKAGEKGVELGQKGIDETREVAKKVKKKLE